MSDAYVTEKTLADLDCQFRLEFGKRWLDVYIWKSEAGLHANTRFCNQDYSGAYVGCYDRKKRSGLFGEVHLVISEIGAGYVAHELMHFMLDWMTNAAGVPETSCQNERVCFLMSDLTSLFWTLFYERYEAAKP